MSPLDHYRAYQRLPHRGEHVLSFDDWWEAIADAAEDADMTVREYLKQGEHRENC